MKQAISKESNFSIFRILWLGGFINAIGTGLTTFALTVHIYQTTESTSLTSLIAIIGLLPRIIVSPYAGALVDKFDRRLILMLGDGLSGLGLILVYMGLTTSSQEGSLIYILVGLFISAIFASLTMPAIKVSISDILGEEDYAKAASMLQINDSVGYLVAPILAGFLLQFIKIDHIILIDASTIFVTLICSYYVKKHVHTHTPSDQDEDSSWQYLKAGWMYLKGQAHISLLIIYLSLLTFFLAFIQILITPILLSLTDSLGYGWSMSIAASGMLIFGIYTSVQPIKGNFIKILGLALAVTSLMMMGIGLVNNLYIITVMAFILFGSLVYANTTLDYLFRKNVPSHYLGRTLGWASNISQLGYLLAYVIAGLLADYIFDPLLQEGGLLSGSLGFIFGIGDHRGTGLLVFLAGACLLLSVYLFYKNPQIKQLKE